MKNTILILLSLVFISATTFPTEEKWETLFDGETLNGWHRFNRKGVTPVWTAKEGVLTFDPELRPKGDYIHDLVTDKVYKSFELSIEWNISEGGNSGIFWGVMEDPAYPEAYQSGPEIQVLDNAKHPDAFVGEGTHTAGALYDMIAPTADHTNPAGSWNHCVLRVDHRINKGLVFMNGHQIVEFTLDGPEWDEMVAQSKFADWPVFGKSPKGHIGLQDHGDQVAYRNVKIKHLVD